MNALRIAAGSFYTKKLCSRFFKRSAILEGKRLFCVFDSLPLWGTSASYDDHLIFRLIGKRVVDFLLVLTELFPPGVTAEALRLRDITCSKSAIAPMGDRLTQNFR